MNLRDTILAPLPPGAAPPSLSSPSREAHWDLKVSDIIRIAILHLVYPFKPLFNSKRSIVFLCPRCGPFQIGFFVFQVGHVAGRSMARGCYRRQREYPQPPPPSKSSTKITINKVSIVSPLFRLSILNSVRALFVPDLPMRGKGCVSDSFLRLSEGNEETARYKRRNSRPKGRIRFRKDALEPTNSLTRRNCPRASFIRVYSGRQSSG
jgi:hypothetical protein